MARNHGYLMGSYEYDHDSGSRFTARAKSSQSRTGQRNSATKKVARTKSAKLVTTSLPLLSRQRSGYRNWHGRDQSGYSFKPQQFIRLLHESSIGRGLVISCAYSSDGMVASVMSSKRHQVFDQQRLQRCSTGDSTGKTEALIYNRFSDERQSSASRALHGSI